MRSRAIRQIFITLFAFISISVLEAKNFGIFGQAFPIEEQNLKRGLQEKASHLSQSDVEKRSQLLGEKIKKEGLLFKKISWIEEASHYHSFFYDPSISLEEDILDADGNILFKKGMKLNPLEHVTLDSGLLFFDGNNPKHIDWAESQTGEFKWILIGGDPLNLQEDKEHPVFFDQGGFYSKKFQVKHVPCRITQSARALLVEEIPIQKEKL